ncbi:hypothetical protein AAG570_002598 [Ranatra chinensis]|uniref:Uncharacterized protein n=1 Tax=Ranatra chinensis TaxID=642074 RepID=A0ABD0Y837_9HEMI
MALTIFSSYAPSPATQLLLRMTRVRRTTSDENAEQETTGGRVGTCVGYSFLKRWCPWGIYTHQDYGCRLDGRDLEKLAPPHHLADNTVGYSVNRIRVFVWIPCDSLVNVQAKAAGTASGREWNKIKRKVCNFVVHDRCLKTVVSPCSSIAASLIKKPPDGEHRKSGDYSTRRSQGQHLLSRLGRFKGWVEEGREDTRGLESVRLSRVTIKSCPLLMDRGRLRYSYRGLSPLAIPSFIRTGFDLSYDPKSAAEGGGQPKPALED